jgi:hypothetical protein
MSQFDEWKFELEQIATRDGYVPKPNQSRDAMLKYYGIFYRHGWTPQQTWDYHDRPYKPLPEGWEEE